MCGPWRRQGRCRVAGLLGVEARGWTRLASSEGCSPGGEEIRALAFESVQALHYSEAYIRECTEQQHGNDRWDHCTHGDNGQHGVGPSVPQQDVYEGDDLQGFPQPHAVSQDTAKTTATLVPLQGLHKVIVQKADSSNLTDNGDKIRWINT